MEDGRTIIDSTVKNVRILVGRTSGAGGIGVRVVEELPSNPSSKIQYLIPNPDGDSVNAHDVYMYIDNEWLLLGSTYIDPQKYYTKTEADKKFIEKTDKNKPNGIATLGADGQVPAEQLGNVPQPIEGNGITINTNTREISVKIAEGENFTFNENGEIQYESKTRIKKAESYVEPISTDYDVLLIDIPSTFPIPTTGIPSISLNIDTSKTPKSQAVVVIIKNNIVYDAENPLTEYVKVTIPNGTWNSGTLRGWSVRNGVTLNQIPAGGTGEFNFLFLNKDNEGNDVKIINIVGESVL